jgi:hypothetical protein
MSTWGGHREGAGRPRGSQSPNTKARREAARQIVQRFEIDHPNAFPGDAVSLLQCVYRNPDVPLEVRIDAASKAARFERPALAATLTRDVMLIPSTPEAINQRIEELLRKGLGNGVKVIEG